MPAQLRIVLDLSQDDLYFLGYHISGNAHGADIAGAYSRNLHGDILAEGLKVLVGGHAIQLKLDQDANTAAAVGVADYIALVASEATDLQVFRQW